MAAFNSLSSTGFSLPASNTGNTVTNGQTMVVSELPCYTTTGTPLSSPSMGTGFSGYIWINYTIGSGAATPLGGANPFHTVKAMTIKAVVT